MAKQIKTRLQKLAPRLKAEVREWADTSPARWNSNMSLTALARKGSGRVADIEISFPDGGNGYSPKEVRPLVKAIQQAINQFATTK